MCTQVSGAGPRVRTEVIFLLRGGARPYLLSEGVEEDGRVEHCGEGEGLGERGAARDVVEPTVDACALVYYCLQPQRRALGPLPRVRPLVWDVAGSKADRCLTYRRGEERRALEHARD